MAASYVVSLLAAVLVNTSMPLAQVQAVLSDQHVWLSLIDEACADLVGGRSMRVVAPRRLD